MKPVKLIIEGINSFIEPQTLDFEAVGRNNLFCISGKTGAGKTTIFDSLMLALYGRSGKGNLADVVNLSRTTARVTLDFTENGERYTVERTIKCKHEKAENGENTDKRSATSECMLYKNGAPIAKGEEATEFIAGIIGLEAGEFKNVYLLEQGEYAEFLKKPPAKQTEAVGKIFSLMRFGDVSKLASERKKSEQAKAEGIEQRIADLGDVSQDKLHEEKTALTALKSKTTTLKKEEEAWRAELAELEKARLEYISVREKMNNVKNLMLQSDEQQKKLFVAEQAKEEFEKTLDPSVNARLTELNERLNALSALNSIDKEYAAAVKSAAEKTAAAESKRKEVEEAAAQCKALADKSAEDNAAFCELCRMFTVGASAIEQRSETVERAISALGAENVRPSVVTDALHALESEKSVYDALKEQSNIKRSQLERKRGDCERILQVIEKYTAEAKSIAEQKRDAEQAEQNTAKALSAAMLCSHAAAVRAELHDGDVCPVCGGSYHGGGAEGDSDVGMRKAEHEKSVQALKNIAQKEADCAKLTDRSKGDYDHACAEKTELEQELAETERKMIATHVDESAYANFFDILKKAKAAGEQAERSAERLTSKQPMIATLTAESTAALAAVAEAEKKAEEYKAKLGENCGKTGEQIEKVRAEKTALEKIVAETEEKRKRIASEAESARAAVDAVQRSLDAARADCPVDIPEFDEEAYTEKREALDRLTKHVTENEKDIAVKELQVKALAENCEKSTALMSERNAYIKSADRFNTIAELTKGKAMLNYVAAEYIADFTAAASDILNDLSGGKYTMSYDKTNGFVVSDYLNDGKSRKTDTLSGGELFLASLSVAIAIARTQSRGNNAFFFLDEGFGTLDEELIDTVFGALESLSRDCLVGVISHAAALIDRMPSCVEVLEATDTTGSVIKY